MTPAELGLTQKEYIFVLAYIEDDNGTKAAIKAGYATKSAHVTASKLLKKPKITEAMTKVAAAMLRKYEVTPERVLKELVLIGFANMQNYTRLFGGDPVLDFTEAHGDRDKMAAVMELQTEDYMDGRGEDARAVKKIKMKLYPKTPALVRLGEYLGLFEKQKSQGNTTFEFTMQMGEGDGARIRIDGGGDDSLIEAAYSAETGVYQSTDLPQATPGDIRTEGSERK